MLLLLGISAATILTGCSSLAGSHRQRVDALYSARAKILAINRELQDMEQIMLHCIRIHSGALAHAAMDVLTAIHGQPDDAEKIYAQNITADLLAKDKARAIKLLTQRAALKSTIDGSRSHINADIAKLTKLEAKYEYASKLITACSIGAALLIFAFLALKFLL